MEVTRIAGQEEKQIKNVAAYARVSTLQEEQELSYNSQKEYYEAYIRSVPNWNFVGMYADQGKSGVREDRPEFTRMLNDAYAGKIDTILVKSISRFARNAIVTQNVVHKLKAHNVEVIFDEQKLSSFNRNSEMVLNMMATVAEHESRSISKNIKWALDKRAEQGIRNYGNNHVLGYDEVDGVLVPNESAWVVRYMYKQSAAGVSIQSIINELKKMGVNARVMKENGYVPKRSFEVVFYAEEEGSNFQVPVMGSKILTGKLGIDDLKKMKTLDGETAYDTIKKAGFEPDKIPEDVIPEGRIKAALELHIEQSVRLDLEKHTIGIIEGIAGCQWYRVTFKGKQNHAGATPMHLRQDPMCAASECISKVKDMAKETSPTAVATVGFIEAKPNIPNAIPAEVSFTVDIRDIKNESMDEIAEKLVAEAENAAKANGCTVECECGATSKAIEIRDYMKETMKEEADKLGLDYIFMPSGAVHDSNYMAEITDVGMIFVPSIDGRSHVPEEKTDFEHIKLGADLLLNTILRLTAE